MTTDTTYKEKFDLKELELNALLEITQAINNNLPEESLYKIYNFTLRAHLQIAKMALFVHDEEWSCKTFFGIRSKICSEQLTESLLSCEKITQLDPNAHGPLLAEFSLVIPIAHKTRKLAFVFVRGSDSIESDEDIVNTNFIQALSNIIIVAIENKKLARRQLEQEMFKRELEIAGNLQTYLFPKSLPKNEVLQVDAYYQPHHAIGGDYYDFITINEDQFLLCIADVSGKGIPAAMLMANFQASLRTLVRKTTLLQDIVTDLNYHIISNAQGQHFITVFIGIYDFKRKRFKYINSGHNPPIMLQPNAEPKMLDKGSTVLGVFDDLPFLEVGVLENISEFTIAAYTDGITETQNTHDDEYGTDRLIELVKLGLEKPLPEITQSIVNDVNDFRGGAPVKDDLTLLICRLNNNTNNPKKALEL
ncbi:MAG: SpoIIE family protein phosphatase [Cyclobacteriaceae bacterium]